MSIDLASPIDALSALLAGLGLARAAFIRGDGGALEPSHPALEPLARAIQALPDFDDHEAIFVECSRRPRTLLGATLHRTVRGQGAGGVRHWGYDSLGAYLRDGLRLSRGMGRKNALAGLFWGGGKGVIGRAPGAPAADPAERRDLYEEYGRFVTSLRGCYVTAEDVGTRPDDMANVFHTTRFATCIPEAVGGSGNPSPATARGVVAAMEAALGHLGLGSLAGKRVAMQGTGNVGSSMIAELVDRGVAGVVAADVNAEQCATLAARFAGAPVSVRHVALGDTSIFDEECDVFAPNALGAVLSPLTIPRLRCRVVCGAANNQLEDEQRDDRALSDRGITYVPDFVANRMGIVTCANEQYGSFPGDPAILRHFDPDWEDSVPRVTRRILEQAERTGSTTTRAANALADAASLVPHPIFPHRGRDLVRALRKERWHEGSSSA